jgi:Fur family ferric uptake transcriptional regulator
MDCLTPGTLSVEAEPLWKTFSGRIDKVEVRVDGICKQCLNL